MATRRTVVPTTPRRTKLARHPTHWVIYAPMAGDIDGARLIAIMIVARARVEPSRS